MTTTRNHAWTEPPRLAVGIRNVGLALHIPAFMCLASVPVSLLASEYYTIPALLITAILALGLGQAAFWHSRAASRLQVKHAMDIAVIAWLLVPLVGMLPFILIAGSAQAPQIETLLLFRDPANALFEAMSGFTSTGLTMTVHPEEMPLTLLWWRSFTQWVGGVGVIVLMVTILHPTADAQRLYMAEGHDQMIGPTVVTTVRNIWWIYVLFTAMACVGLRLSGMTWWQALNYGMTGIATGGFGVTSGNLGDFDAAPRLVLIVIMLVSALSFAVHHKVLTTRRLRHILHDSQARLLAGVAVGGGVLLFLETRWSHSEASWLDVAVQWSSAITTSGFQSADLTLWSPSAHLLLIAAMFVGGAAGSTAGGLKLRRLILLGQGVGQRVRRAARQPWRLTEHEALGDPHEAALHRHNLEAAAVLAFLWSAVIVLGAVVLLHVTPADLNEVLVEMASATGNVGLSAGIAQPDLHPAGKLALVLAMWTGRLEILPVLVLLRSFRN